MLGYLLALDDVDTIVALIRAASDADEAREQADGAGRLEVPARRSSIASRADRLARQDRGRATRTSRMRDHRRAAAPSSPATRGQASTESIGDELGRARHRPRDGRRAPHADRRRRGATLEPTRTSSPSEDIVVDPHPREATPSADRRRALYRAQRRGGRSASRAPTCADDDVRRATSSSPRPIDCLLFFTTESAGSTAPKVLRAARSPARRCPRGRAIANLLAVPAQDESGDAQ